MIYAIGDVHGCHNKMQAMLDKISPTETDEVYFIGDIIDRGPQSAQCLRFAVDEAPANIRFLRGNHEDMAACVICKDPTEMSVAGWPPWMYNGGDETAQELFESTTEEWRKEKLVPWIQSLVPYAEVTTEQGDNMLLVHAGLNPRAWSQGNHFFCDQLNEAYADQNRYELSNGLGTQYAQHMLWARAGWYDTEAQPAIHVIFGHTPVPYIVRQRGERASWGTLPPWLKTVPETDNQIWHNDNLHDIDCGCVFNNGRLAALRIDDMQEFYV